MSDATPALARVCAACRQPSATCVRVPDGLGRMSWRCEPCRAKQRARQYERKKRDKEST